MNWRMKSVCAAWLGMLFIGGCDLDNGVRPESPPLQPPCFSQVQAEPEHILLGEQTTLSCSAYDNLGSEIHYGWTGPEGTHIEGQGSTVTASADHTGFFYFRVEATNAAGASESGVVVGVGARTAPPVLWQRSCGDVYSTFIAERAAMTSSGGFVLVGERGGYCCVSGHGFVRVIDAEGNEAWTADGPTYSRYLGVVQTSNGDFITAGGSGYDVYSVNIGVARYSADGDTLWERQYGGPGWDQACNILALNDSLFVVPATTDMRGVSAIQLLWINGRGDSLKAVTIAESPGLVAHNMQKTTDGGFVIVGRQDSTNLLLIRLDPEGTVVWSRTYSGFADYQTYSVSPTPEGGYVVAADTSVVRFNSAGDLLWRRNHVVGAPYGNNHLRDVVADDLGYLLVGTCDIFNYPQGSFFKRVNSEGDLVWYYVNNDYQTAITLLPAAEGSHVLATSAGILLCLGAE
jgi:hypothetical protein